MQILELGIWSDIACPWCYIGTRRLRDGIARTEGLEFDFATVRPANTAKAHELLHFAKSRGRQAETNERLFRAHFGEGRHVGRVEDLAELAAEAGLDRDDALGALRSGAYEAAVHADLERAAALGIRGVPFHVIDDAYGVSGAQSPATFAAALERAATDETRAARGH